MLSVVRYAEVDVLLVEEVEHSAHLLSKDAGGVAGQVLRPWNMMVVLLEAVAWAAVAHWLLLGLRAWAGSRQE